MAAGIKTKKKKGEPKEGRYFSDLWASNLFEKKKISLNIDLIAEAYIEAPKQKPFKILWEEIDVEAVADATSSAEGGGESEAPLEKEEGGVDTEAVADAEAEGEEASIKTQVTDPVTGETPPEPPEAEDLTLMPYNEKISMIVAMIKEYGYSGVKFKINGNKNSLEVFGKLDDNDKTAITELTSDLDLKAHIDEKDLNEEKEGEEILTRISFDNPMDAKKFKDIYKIILRKEKEKEAMMMCLGGA